MKIAQGIRHFFEELFVGNAHAHLVAHLEGEVSQLRHERDVFSAKCDRYEAILMPLQSSGGAAYVQSLRPKRELSKPQVELQRGPSWQEVQQKWAEQQSKEEAEVKQQGAN